MGTFPVFDKMACVEIKALMIHFLEKEDHSGLRFWRRFGLHSNCAMYLQSYEMQRSLETKRGRLRRSAKAL